MADWLIQSFQFDPAIFKLYAALINAALIRLGRWYFRITAKFLRLGVICFPGRVGFQFDECRT